MFSFCLHLQSVLSVFEIQHPSMGRTSYFLSAIIPAFLLHYKRILSHHSISDMEADLFYISMNGEFERDIALRTFISVPF